MIPTSITGPATALLHGLVECGGEGKTDAALSKFSPGDSGIRLEGAVGGIGEEHDILPGGAALGQDLKGVHLPVRDGDFVAFSHFHG